MLFATCTATSLCYLATSHMPLRHPSDRHKVIHCMFTISPVPAQPCCLIFLQVDANSRHETSDVHCHFDLPVRSRLRPFTSCRKDTSPIKRVAAFCRPNAHPAAVLIKPSIPLAPLNTDLATYFHDGSSIHFLLLQLENATTTRMHDLCLSALQAT
jgi:hypothetical protein